MREKSGIMFLDSTQAGGQGEDEEVLEVDGRDDGRLTVCTGISLTRRVRTMKLRAMREPILGQPLTRLTR